MAAASHGLYGDGSPEMSGRETTVRIASSERPGIYVAWNRCDLLRTTYSAEFEDNVMDGIALYGFVVMLRRKCGLQCVELVLEVQALRLWSRAVVDDAAGLVPGGLR